jgi:hypothetical protein
MTLAHTAELCKHVLRLARVPAGLVILALRLVYFHNHAAIALVILALRLVYSHNRVAVALVTLVIRLVYSHNNDTVVLVMLALLEKLTAATSMHEKSYLEDEDAVRKYLTAHGCVR